MGYYVYENWTHERARAANPRRGVAACTVTRFDAAAPIRYD